MIQGGGRRRRSQPTVYDAGVQAIVQGPGVAVAGPAAPTLWQRAAPVLCGCALAASAAYVAVQDPATPGSHFPACQFHAVTGLWCPACGLTRGTHDLLTGHVGAALGENLFVPVVLAVIVGSWWSWTRSSWGRPSLRLQATGHWLRARLAVAIPVVAVVYGVLRNLPFTPFRALAP